MAQLRGPITFPQERLLSYFWNLLKNEGADDEAAAWDERAAQQQQSAEVFMLLRSLVSLRLLSQARHMPHVSVWLLDYALLGALLQQSDLAVMILVLYHCEHRILPVLSSATLQVTHHAPCQILQTHFQLCRPPETCWMMASTNVISRMSWLRS